LVIVEHGRFFAQPVPARHDQLDAAGRVIDSIRSRDPVLTYREFSLSARAAASTRGDYAEAILKAAVAAEILLKNSAAVLIWKVLTYGKSPAPDWAKGDKEVLGRRPAFIIGSILSPALGGNWDSSKLSSPVGAWRHNIARLRNSVIHRGHQPSDSEAAEAVDALRGLERHVCDRIAARAQQYPRAAVMSVGLPKLEERGAAGRVRATLANSGTENWNEMHVAWRDGLDLDDSDDS
jgi:hypothetical protein